VCEEQLCRGDRTESWTQDQDGCIHVSSKGEREPVSSLGESGLLGAPSRETEVCKKTSARGGRVGYGSYIVKVSTDTPPIHSTNELK